MLLKLPWGWAHNALNLLSHRTSFNHGDQGHLVVEKRYYGGKLWTEEEYSSLGCLGNHYKKKSLIGSLKTQNSTWLDMHVTVVFNKLLYPSKNKYKIFAFNAHTYSLESLSVQTITINLYWEIQATWLFLTSVPSNQMTPNIHAI